MNSPIDINEHVSSRVAAGDNVYVYENIQHKANWNYWLIMVIYLHKPNSLAVLYNLKFNYSIILQTTMRNFFTILDYAKVFRGGDFSPFQHQKIRSKNFLQWCVGYQIYLQQSNSLKAL